jgi:hypothetical protein
VPAILSVLIYEQERNYGKLLAHFGVLNGFMARFSYQFSRTKEESPKSYGVASNHRGLGSLAPANGLNLIQRMDL